MILLLLLINSDALHLKVIRSDPIGSIYAYKIVTDALVDNINIYFTTHNITRENLVAFNYNGITDDYSQWAYAWILTN